MSAGARCQTSPASSVLSTRSPRQRLLLPHCSTPSPVRLLAPTTLLHYPDCTLWLLAQCIAQKIAAASLV